MSSQYTPGVILVFESFATVSCFFPFLDYLSSVCCHFQTDGMDHLFFFSSVFQFLWIRAWCFLKHFIQLDISTIQVFNSSFENHIFIFILCLTIKLFDDLKHLGVNRSTITALSTKKWLRDQAWKGAIWKQASKRVLSSTPLLYHWTPTVNILIEI